MVAFRQCQARPDKRKPYRTCMAAQSALRRSGGAAHAECLQVTCLVSQSALLNITTISLRSLLLVADSFHQTRVDDLHITFPVFATL